MGVAYDISLMIIDGNVENLVQNLNDLRVVFVKNLCLENLHKAEAAKTIKR